MLFQLYLAFLVGHLLLLVVASRKAAPYTILLSGEDNQRFLILIPAHNEERLLPDLLASLTRMDYPKDLFQVHVVADNCTDKTAEVAQYGDTQVHIRNDHEHPGKGRALNWLQEQLKQVSQLYDALVFLDADSVVSPNFLRAMAAHLERGERVIQAYYSVRDPDQSWVGSLRFAALSVLHFLRPQGRMVLGASAGLKGNGMVFSTELMDYLNWSSSQTEDIELHMALLLSGERVFFAPEATVWGEMPDKLSGSTSQHFRWEHGRKQMAQRYIPKLLAAAMQSLRTGHPRRAFLLGDAVMEYLQPPFSILAAASLLGLIASLAFSIIELSNSNGNLFIAGYLALLNVFLAVGLLLGQGVYLFAGLRSVSAPKKIYLTLMRAPQMIIWKTWLMFQMILGRRPNSWIRTKRNKE